MTEKVVDTREKAQFLAFFFVPCLLVYVPFVGTAYIVCRSVSKRGEGALLIFSGKIPTIYNFYTQREGPYYNAPTPFLRYCLIICHRNAASFTPFYTSYFFVPRILYRVEQN